MEFTGERYVPAMRHRRAFLACASAALALKLWLTAQIRVTPVYAPHDMSNYLEHAKTLAAGHWWGAYDAFTLIKLPSFAIYLAALEDTGIPAPLAHQLFYGLACLVACLAVAPVVRRWAWLAVLYVVILFDPFTYCQQATVVMRSQLNEWTALLTLACATGLFLRRRRSWRATLPWMIGLAFSFAVFWFNREEHVWIVPGLVVVLGAYFWLSGREQSRAELRARLATLVIPAAVWLAYLGTVTLLNGKVYGWYTVSEQSAPEFVSAYNSLARIEAPGTDDPWYPLPRNARSIAYAVSPAAAELRTGFEGPSGKNWTGVTCAAVGRCEDIAGSWAMWAFRDAVAGAGHYRSGAEARDFYLRLAAELDAACDARKIACRPKGHGLLPPVTPAALPAIAARFRDAVQITVTMDQWDITPWADLARDPGLVNDYEVVTRAVRPLSAVRVYSGWLADSGLRSLDVEGPSGPDTQAQIRFGVSPDVYEFLHAVGRPVTAQANLARFTVVTRCLRDCTLIVNDGRAQPKRIALGPASPDVRDDRLSYHLDATQRSDAGAFDDDFKTAALTEIGRTYQTALRYVLLVGIVAALFRSARAFRRRSLRLADHAVVMLAVLASVGALLLGLSVVAALSFPGLIPEYMLSLYPTLLFAVGFAALAEGRLAWALVSRCYPRAAALPSGASH